MKKTVLLLLSLIFCVRNYDCPLSYGKQTQIYSDSVSISANKNINQKQDLVYNYQFDKSFERTPKVGLGLNELNSDQSPFLEVVLEVTKTKKEGIYFHAVSSQKSKWKNIKLNFLATTRGDIELGTVSISEPHYFQGDYFNLKYPIKIENSGHGFKVKHFIQGFNIQSKDKQHMGIKHYGTSISKKQILIKFSNHKRASIIHSLTISIVGFNIYTPGVLYADGIIDQNYVKSKTQITIPKHGINQLRTYLVGINSFETSAAQPISISSSIDEKFVLNIGPIDRCEIDYISVSYLIISIIDCGSCTGYPLLFKGLCRLQCPKGTIQKNGKCIPIDCIRGYYLNDLGQCIPECKQNEYYSQNRCICLQGYNLINGICSKCPSGTFFNFKTLKCESVCGKNAQYYDGRCHCFDGYFNINNSCRKCPLGTQYSPIDKTCKNACEADEVFTINGCQCKQGYYKIQGKCGVCEDGTVYNNNFRICQCRDGLQWNQQQRKCLPPCNFSEVYINGKCQCQPYFYYINNVCGQCPPRSLYSENDQTCLCGYKSKYQQGKCIPECDEREYYNEMFGRCVPYCHQFAQIWQNQQCICAQGFIRNLQDNFCYPQCGPFQYRLKGECQCIQGYHKGVYGPCQPIVCPPGHKWNKQRRQCQSVCGDNKIYHEGKCVCVNGYEFDQTFGVCLPKCPNGKVRNRGKCNCPNGNVIVNGKCTDCPKYTQYVNGVCLCYNGKLPYNGKCQYLSCPDKNQVWDPIGNVCKCRRPLIWMLGRCQYMDACRQNQHWNGKSCICKYGYILKYGNCVPVDDSPPQCPDNSAFNGVNCQCLPGFYPISPGICAVCPSGTHWDGYRCEVGDYACADGYIWDIQKGKCVPENQCGHYQIWDGVNCRCIQGTFWIQGKCQKCEYGTFFDGLKCSDVKIPDCGDPYMFWNGQECTWNKCVKCPPYSYWNGVCCKVRVGHYIDFTVPSY